MMGGWTGIWQWVVVLAIILLLFGGRGKISSIMGDFGKGLKSFKKNIKDEQKAQEEDVKALETEPVPVTETVSEQEEATKN